MLAVAWEWLLVERSSPDFSAQQSICENQRQRRFSHWSAEKKICATYALYSELTCHPIVAAANKHHQLRGDYGD
jgi:hypothetical protein